MSVDVLIPISIAELKDLKEKQPILNNASRIQESNRRPDVYYYIARGGRLYTPEGFLIRKQIREETYLDRLEVRAFDRMEELSSREEQTMIWISPPQFGIYDVTKIIITQVISQGEYNMLFNRSVVLDGVDSDKSIEIAQELARGAINNPRLKTVDDVRANLVILNPGQQYLLSVLEELIPDPQWQMIRSGQDMELQKQALAAARLVYESKFKSVEERIGIEEYAGDKPGSCDLPMIGAFEAFLGGSRSSEGCSKIKCGNKLCNWEPDSYYLGLIQAKIIRSCINCGWSP